MSEPVPDRSPADPDRPVAARPPTARPATSGTGAPTSFLRDYLAHPRHGPLPALLLVLTAVTGIVDAASILGLGRVFVANMTGNVVFIGFGLAGADGFTLDASLAALAGFLVGAALGGVLVARMSHRGRLLALATLFAAGLLGVAALLSLADLTSAPARDSVAALCAVALGGQNAAVRKLAVPDLTTTVLTMTLTGIAADLRAHQPRVAVRRLLSVAAMLLGAAGGALLVRHTAISVTLALAVFLVAAVSLGAWLASRRSAAWQTS